MQLWRNRQKEQGVVTAVVDAYYAECDETRQSTRGGALKLDCHCFKSGGVTQQVAALPTGEAKLYGVA